MISFDYFVDSSIDLAKSNNFTYVTPEHFLYALTNCKEGIEIFRLINFEISIEKLQKDLRFYFIEYVPKVQDLSKTLDDNINKDIVKTLNFKAMCEFTENYYLGFENLVDFENKDVKIIFALLSIYNIEESYAKYYLNKYGITHLKIMEYIKNANGNN